MDFYHVLPSNTSPEYFPKNNAAEYSTPLNNPYTLTGNWEVALIDLTYSTCINTFNNDAITVGKPCTLVQCVKESKQVYKVMLPLPKEKTNVKVVREELVASINEYFADVLSAQIIDGGGYVEWKLMTDDYCFILSESLQSLFGLWSDVLSTADSSFKNVHAFKKHNIPSDENDCFIIIVPILSNESVTSTKYVMKKEAETIDIAELAKRFNESIPQNIAHVTQNKSQVFLYKTQSDNHIIRLNEALTKTLTYTHIIHQNEDLMKTLTYTRSSMYKKSNLQYYAFNDSRMKDEWSVSIITLKKVTKFTKALPQKIIIPPRSFEIESNAMSYLNDKVNSKHIKFGCTTSHHTTLTIAEKGLTVTLDDNLRDIFGFDRNKYIGPKTYTSKHTFSLRRCIQFLYVYSNLTEFIRIGDTQAPLLAIVPFSDARQCSFLKQKIFKTPMYIRVNKDRISQIDIAIYDGAGQLVPFASDAVTTARVHFHQI